MNKGLLALEVAKQILRGKKRTEEGILLCAGAKKKDGKLVILCYTSPWKDEELVKELREQFYKQFEQREVELIDIPDNQVEEEDNS
jgi:SRSO17 transposase